MLSFRFGISYITCMSFSTTHVIAISRRNLFPCKERFLLAALDQNDSRRSSKTCVALAVVFIISRHAPGFEFRQSFADLLINFFTNLQILSPLTGRKSLLLFSRVCLYFPFESCAVDFVFVILGVTNESSIQIYPRRSRGENKITKSR